MTVFTEVRRVTGLAHRPGPSGPRPLKIGIVGAVLVALVLSFGFAAPANAAADYVSFNCYSSAGRDYWCNAYSEPGHILIGDAGLTAGNGHDYTVKIRNHSAAFELRVRVVADGAGQVIDYPDWQNGRRLTYGIQRMYVWAVGWALSPPLTVR